MSKSGPLVSIIIPCFNVAEFVGDALASAISQTYDRVEIIAVDDGSTDDTLRILESYGERVRVVKTAHRGAAAARNIGAESAQGDLLQFLDADDVLDERKLAVQLRGLGSHDGVIRYCDEITVDASDGRILRRYSPDLEGDDPVPMLISNSLSVEAAVIWKEFFDAVGGFREELVCNQEYDLYLRLGMERYRFEHIAEVLFTVRKRAGGISADYEVVLRHFGEIIEPAYRRMQERGELTPERRSALAGRLGRAARHAALRDDFDTAQRYLRLGKEIDVQAMRREFGPWLWQLAEMIGVSNAVRLRRFLTKARRPDQT